MGVYIDKFEPKYGLYQIDQNKIHKYKGKGGTVRVYPIQEIDLVRCGECKYWESAKNGWNGYCENKVDAFNTFYANDFCSFGERRADGDI